MEPSHQKDESSYPCSHPWGHLSLSQVSRLLSTLFLGSQGGVKQETPGGLDHIPAIGHSQRHLQFHAILPYLSAKVLLLWVKDNFACLVL